MTLKLTHAVRALAIVASGLCAFDAGAAEPAPNVERIRSAIQKSIPLLEAGSRGSIEQRPQCFNCHNQGLPIMALTIARSRGFSIDTDNFQRQVQFAAKFLERNQSRYQEGEGQGGQIDTAGFALWTLDVSGEKDNETTAAVAEYLLLRQRDQDHYEPESERPPSEHSHFTSTYVALRGLKRFGLPDQHERIDNRVAQIRHWLETATPTETEDEVFRLRLLHLIGAADRDLQTAAQQLLAQQRDDGGWSQMADMASDAYATGTALVALLDTGSLATDDPRYQHGVEFLLAQQLDDGSWHVVSRSKPFQTYFESGYPHGKDQFISMAAASWATMALVRTLPEIPPQVD